MLFNAVNENSPGGSQFCALQVSNCVQSDTHVMTFPLTATPEL